MIKVLVVEDSPVVREFLVRVLSSDDDLRVVATATNGKQALATLEKIRPDVITMDIHMPEMDGLEATRAIMNAHPTPIVIVSGSSSVAEAATAFRALEAGALAVIERPRGIGHPEHDATAARLVSTVKLMAEVKVVRRWRTPSKGRSPRVPKPQAGLQPENLQLIAIGASTGGPQALQAILRGLPWDFPLPILVVQHISPGFSEGFVEWLGSTSALPVKLPRQGEAILPGHVYVAPQGFQLKIEPARTMSLLPEGPQNGHCPSVSFLFRSVAEVFGGDAVGILLTGMGRDGASELKLLRDEGALTIAQSEESSVVPGMPGEAIKLNAAVHVLSPGQIAAFLKNLGEEWARVRRVAQL